MPSLTVCLITKNEEPNIARALRSVRGLTKDVLVADDTTSTDNTARIAAAMGARVVKVVWENSFAQARNFVLDQAAGDWVFWLDADEEVLPSSHDEIRRCIARDDAIACLVQRQDLYDEAKPDDFTTMWQLRLMRRHPRLRWSARIHEQPADLEHIAADERQRILPTTITLRHYGYVLRLRTSKHLRNAPLLRLELKDRPGQVYYMTEYGRTLLELGDETGHDVLAEAVRVMLADAGSERPHSAYALLLEYAMRFPARCKATRKSFADLALRWFPRSPPLLWLIAQDRFERSDYPGAANVLETLVGLGRNGGYDKTISFDPRIIGHDAIVNLGVAYLRMADLDRAEACFRSLPCGGSSPVAAANLTQIQALRRRFHAR